MKINLLLISFIEQIRMQTNLDYRTKNKKTYYHFCIDDVLCSKYRLRSNQSKYNIGQQSVLYNLQEQQQQTMTTFQRFQRNQRSHLSLSQNSKKAPESYGSLKIRELVRFSQKQIYFQYNEDLSCKASLKITNLSESRIHFKVRSNNPSMYRVTPFQQIIQDQQQSTVCFEYLYKQKSEEFLQRQRIKKDKFQIIWGKLSNNPGQRNVLSESKIFNAHFSNHPQTQFSQPSLSQIKSTQKVNSPFDLNQYSNNRQRNPQATQSLLRKDIIIGVSLVSFLLGFILT